MGFIRRLRDRAAEERARRQASREQQAAEKQRAAQVAQEQQRAAQEAAAKEWQRHVLGPELADMEVNTPAEAKLAIKLARLRKKEIQAQKRDLASGLADVREAWRERQAGRISTRGAGRGTGGKIIRGAVQAKRQGERMDHAQRVNQLSDARQELDQQIGMIDRLIIDLERKTLKKEA